MRLRNNKGKVAGLGGQAWAVIAILAIAALGYTYFVKQAPMATVGGTPSGAPVTPLVTTTVTQGAGVTCLASDTASINIRVKNSANKTSDVYSNGTWYVYQDGTEVDTGKTVTGGTYNGSSKITCGQPGKVVFVSTSGGTPAIEQDFPAFKGNYFMSLAAPQQNWQLKLQATSKTGAAHTIFDNNTTAYVTVPATLQASGLKISPVSSNAANTSNNITAGQTLTELIYMSSSLTTAYYGDKDVYVLVSLDDDDWKETALTITWDGQSISETPSAQISDFSWYSGKVTAGLENHFFKLPGGIDGKEHLFKIYVEAEDSIASMNDVELRFVAFGNYLGIDRKVHYGGVDDTSDHNWVLFTPAKIVLPTA